MESRHLFGILAQNLEKLLFGRGKILIAQITGRTLVALAKRARRLGGCRLRDDELEENKKNRESQRLRNEQWLPRRCMVRDKMRSPEKPLEWGLHDNQELREAFPPFSQRAEP